MASRSFDLVKALLKGATVIAGSFRPNGAGAIDNTLNRGSKGWSVARTNVGQYTITLEDGFPSLAAVIGMTQLNAAADGNIQGRGAFDVTTAKTFVLENLAGAAPTEIVSNANNWVHFVAVLKNSEIS